MSSSNKAPTTITVSGSGQSWTNTANATSGAAWATWTIPAFIGTTNAQNLNLTGCGFAIPSGATITDISVLYRVTVDWGDISQPHPIQTLQLMKAGSVVGTSQTDAGSDGTLYTYTKGGLWGTTWTDSDINNSGFGVQVRSACSDAYDDYPNTAYFDGLSITVTYTAGGGATLDHTAPTSTGKIVYSATRWTNPGMSAASTTPTAFTYDGTNGFWYYISG